MNVFQNEAGREMGLLRVEPASSTRPSRPVIMFSQDTAATFVERERFDEMQVVSQSNVVNPIEEDDSHPEFKDAATIELTHLLSSREPQGPAGGLYADHLTSAVTVWLFFPCRSKKEKLERAPSILPRHRLQRVLERMRDLRGDLDLETLATESGYSRSHFLRMFRASTGCTPHRYLLQLRLERAKELMRQKSVSLIDIAALCGFSSHAHLSKMFRQIVGMPPSEYRRNIASLTPPTRTYLEGSR
ncbi:helix-turn-helix domain-containing protein [Terriglobus saanensis]|uniref:Transcriptional regulator, AraC family n=1 Tax=Terriglobus saanensis (strain ATCC BAA-1853 / DSM 23119 / SP1PR4) TaxID=401053 RepID=E8V895_TERSS|nr:helix-turn-helix domain-containing protein [Terriglobus saanensis]ADV81798.1 transcriptional regulator, AraC family [Terriglobus saanensis SP1PR4]